jgi:integrase/recombinase XerD
MAKTYLEPNEIEQLESTATCLRDKLLIRLLFHSGCRVSEALNLQVKDIDFGNATVCILHLKTRLKLSCVTCGQRLGRYHAFCPACGNKVDKIQAEEQQHRRQRILPVDSETLGLLREYIERGGPVVKDGKKLVFGINRHRAWQIIKTLAEEAGLPKLVNPETGRIHNVSPHRIRDCFSVMAVQRDDSTDGIRMLQEWLGHANIGTTMRYRKVAGQELKDWYRKLWNQETDGGVTSQT